MLVTAGPSGGVPSRAKKQHVKAGAMSTVCFVIVLILHRDYMIRAHLTHSVSGRVGRVVGRDVQGEQLAGREDGNEGS